METTYSPDNGEWPASYVGNTSERCRAIELDVNGASGLLYTDLQVAMFRYVLPLVFIGGVFNNSAFIYVVVHSQNMQTTTNKCLVHLAVADLLFLIVGVGEKFWGYAYSQITPDDTPYGPVGCSCFKVARSTAYFASLAFITVVSVERFYAVCKYQKKRNANTYRNVIILCWLASFLLALSFIPSIANFHCFHVTWPNEQPFKDFGTLWLICMPYGDGITIYTDAVQTIPFFVLLVVNVCLYCCIISGLNTAIKRAHLTGKRLRNTEIRNQIAWMLIANGIIFFSLLSPREIYFVIKTFVHGDSAVSETWKAVTEITGVLSYVNSGINPVVYSILSSKHRKAFQDAFLPDKCNPSLKQNSNHTDYIQPSAVNQDATSMASRHSPRLGIKTERTETETV